MTPADVGLALLVLSLIVLAASLTILGLVLLVGSLVL